MKQSGSCRLNSFVSLIFAIYFRHCPFPRHVPVTESFFPFCPGRRHLGSYPNTSPVTELPGYLSGASTCTASGGRGCEPHQQNVSGSPPIPIPDSKEANRDTSPGSQETANPRRWLMYRSGRGRSGRTGYPTLKGIPVRFKPIWNTPRKVFIRKITRINRYSGDYSGDNTRRRRA